MPRFISNKRNGEPFIPRPNFDTAEQLKKKYPHHRTTNTGKRDIIDQRTVINKYNNIRFKTILDRAIELYPIILWENSLNGKPWNKSDMCLIAYLHHHMTNKDEMVADIEEVEVDTDVQDVLDDEQLRFKEIGTNIETFWEKNPDVKNKYDKLAMFKSRYLYDQVIAKIYK